MAMLLIVPSLETFPPYASTRYTPPIIKMIDRSSAFCPAIAFAQPNDLVAASFFGLGNSGKPPKSQPRNILRRWHYLNSKSLAFSLRIYAQSFNSSLSFSLASPTGCQDIFEGSSGPPAQRLHL
jgi:hypothetical protein